MKGYPIQWPAWAKAGRLLRKYGSLRNYKEAQAGASSPKAFNVMLRVAADSAGSKGQLKSSRREALSLDQCLEVHCGSVCRKESGGGRTKAVLAREVKLME